jgi:hypothetical protein
MTFEETVTKIVQQCKDSDDILENVVYEMIFHKYYNKNRIMMSRADYDRLTLKFYPQYGEGGHYVTYPASHLAKYEFEISAEHERELERK